MKLDGRGALAGDLRVGFARENEYAVAICLKCVCRVVIAVLGVFSCVRGGFQGR